MSNLTNLKSREHEFLSYISDLMHLDVSDNDIVEAIDREKKTRFTKADVTPDEMLWLKEMMGIATQIKDYQDEMEISSLIKQWQATYPIMDE